jgi:lipopolysaccharide biosynthesis glycosyltransferase
MKTVAIASAANETYVLGLAVALVSTVAHAPKDVCCKVYVLDGGIRHRSWMKLEKSLARFGSRCELIRLHPDMNCFAGLPQDWGSSVMTYARLALPNLVFEEQLFYVDADMIVQGAWDAIWDAGCGEAVVAAAPDVITRTLGGERLNLEKFNLDAAAPYLQAGLLLINLREWRNLAVSEGVLSYLRENPDHCCYWDQSALNVVLYRRWRQLPVDWNTPAWWADQGLNAASLNAPVLHFVGPHKPWIRGHHQSPSAKVFFQWLDQTPWKGWRPGGVRQACKWAKYKAWKMIESLRSLGRGPVGAD